MDCEGEDIHRGIGVTPWEKQQNGVFAVRNDLKIQGH